MNKDSEEMQSMHVQLIAWEQNKQKRRKSFLLIIKAAAFPSLLGILTPSTKISSSAYLASLSCTHSIFQAQLMERNTTPGCPNPCLLNHTAHKAHSPTLPETSHLLSTAPKAFPAYTRRAQAIDQGHDNTHPIAPNPHPTHLEVSLFHALRIFQLSELFLLAACKALLRQQIIGATQQEQPAALPKLDGIANPEALEKRHRC
eukprot:1158610-Pelagomonas_calceolata.AAC.3